MDPPTFLFIAGLKATRETVVRLLEGGYVEGAKAHPLINGQFQVVSGGSVALIGDYGKTLAIDKDRNTDPKGNCPKVMLHKGTFEVDLTTFAAKLIDAQIPIDKSSCSSEGTVTAPAIDRYFVFVGGGPGQDVWSRRR